MQSRNPQLHSGINCAIIARSSMEITLLSTLLTSGKWFSTHTADISAFLTSKCMQVGKGKKKHFHAQKQKHDTTSFCDDETQSPARYLDLNIDIITHATGNKYRPNINQTVITGSSRQWIALHFISKHISLTKSCVHLQSVHRRYDDTNALSYFMDQENCRSHTNFDDPFTSVLRHVIL